MTEEMKAEGPITPYTEEVMFIKISEIVRDQKFQVRLDLSEEAINHYRRMYAMETEPALPPIVVGEVKGVYYLVEAVDDPDMVLLLHERSGTLESVEGAEFDRVLQLLEDEG